MVVCAVAAALLLAGMALARRRENWERARLPCRILLAFSLLGLLSGYLEYSDSEFGTEGEIRRNEPGGGELETEAAVYLPEEDTEYPVTLVVPEKVFSRQEEQERIAAAVEEIDKTFCGENPSLEAVRENPVVKSSYQDGSVQAAWAFSEECISDQGVIDQKILGGEKQRVEAEVELSCGDSREPYSFTFWILPGTKNRQERVTADIEEQISNQDATEEKIVLPDHADGQKILWRKPKSSMPLELLVLGVLASLAAAYARREQERKKVQKRRRELLLEYPEFVSKLSLLLGSGMTVSGAFRRMDRMYQRQRERGRGRERPAYEELGRMLREMENGMGELRAYQEFSERCDLQPYRKLVALLLSGQRMGNRKLLEQLNEEADRVFSERKNAAKKLGEEAGTKLLFPMLLMLALVMGIVMIPAFLSISSM